MNYSESNKCPRCNGHGIVRIGGSIAFPREDTCPVCGGTGDRIQGANSDLEKYAKQTNKGMILKTLLNQRERVPCAYGAGDVVLSYWYLGGSEDDVRQVSECLKAKQVKDTWLNKNENREAELRKMGCPEPRRRIFGGWRCKYADGLAY